MRVFKTPFRENKLLVKLNQIFRPLAKNACTTKTNRAELKKIKDKLLVSEKISTQLKLGKVEHEEVNLLGFSEEENKKLNRILLRE